MKKLIFGLLVAVTALGFSAFKNEPAHRVVQPGRISVDYIVHPSTTTYVPKSTTPNPSLCTPADANSCFYTVTESGETNIPDQASYTQTQINSYLASGWLTASTQKAVYSGPL